MKLSAKESRAMWGHPAAARFTFQQLDEHLRQLGLRVVRRMGLPAFRACCVEKPSWRCS